MFTELAAVLQNLPGNEIRRDVDSAANAQVVKTAQPAIVAEGQAVAKRPHILNRRASRDARRASH